MTDHNDARRQLLDFINKKAFDPILDASADSYQGKEREQLKDVQRKTQNEKEQFEKDYTSAGKVKKGFLSDVHSEAAKKVNSELEHLGLPTLPSIKDQFMQLCDKLQV
jgi:hypothetical protein